jgi:hypothetical protein
MAQPIYRSVHYTLINALTILAKQGDKNAKRALQEIEVTEYEIIEDGPGEHVEMILEYSFGSYLITQQGASFCPAQDQ